MYIKKWVVLVSLTGTMRCVVEAETEEEAASIAAEKALVSDRNKLLLFCTEIELVGAEEIR